MFKPQIGRIGTGPRTTPVGREINRNTPLTSHLVWCAATSASQHQEMLTGADGFFVDFSGSEATFTGKTYLGQGCGVTVSQEGAGVGWPFSPYLRRITSDITFVWWCTIKDNFGYFWSVNYGDVFWKVSLNIEVDSGDNTFNINWTDSSGSMVKFEGPSNLFTEDELACFATRKKGNTVEWFKNGVYEGNDTLSPGPGDVDWNTEEDVTMFTRNSYSPGDGALGICPLLMLFDKALPTGEIVKLYNSPFLLFGEDIGASSILFDIPAVAYSWNLTMP